MIRNSSALRTGEADQTNGRRSLGQGVGSQMMPTRRYGYRLGRSNAWESISRFCRRLRGYARQRPAVAMPWLAASRRPGRSAGAPLRNSARATQRAFTHRPMHRMKDAASRRHDGRFEDIDAAFVAKDGAGQKLAYVYFDDRPAAKKSAFNLISNAA